MIDKWINTIQCGDAVDLMQQLPAGSVDLVVTSPPYNLKNSSGNGMRDPRGGKWQSAALVNGYDTYDDNMPFNDYVHWQRLCLLEMLRLLPPTGAIFYNQKWRVQKGLLEDRSEIVSGMPVRQIIIWHRSGGINFNPGYFLPTYEVIYLIANPKFKLVPHANALTDVWDIQQEIGNPHPAPFPEELARRCIQSTDAQTILDPFIGSGTTALVADRLDRNWIGFDISERYCEMARDRINADRDTRDRTGQKAVQDTAA